MSDLISLRKQIDAINASLVRLLDQRAQVALQIGKAKKGGAIHDPARERAVLQQVAQLSQGPLSTEAVQSIFSEIIAACRSIQQPEHVAYLGPAGSYTEEAALRYAGRGSTYLPYETVDQAVLAVTSGEANIAVVPVENSSEGAVARTLDLLMELPLLVTGEILLPIRHQLLSRADHMDDIQEIAAHPQALAQCRRWLDAHMPGIPRRSTTSNSQAALLASQDPGIAAIASSRAGELYDLRVLAPNIHSSRSNTTRFFALGTSAAQPTGQDKTSLVCSVPNKPGSLHLGLAILADHGLNMTKLESRPAASGQWDYLFYIDIDGHQHDPQVSEALEDLTAYATFVKILGSYAKADS